MNNKINGNKFERELCKKLSENNIWSRLEYPAEDGSQPFDVKALYRNNFYAFECKDCKNGYFDLSRIEENQRIALQLLGNNLILCNILFAFQFDKDWYFVEADEILFSKDWLGKKRIKKEDMEKFYHLSFDELVEWIKEKGQW